MTSNDSQESSAIPAMESVLKRSEGFSGMMVPLWVPRLQMRRHAMNA